MPRNIRIRTGAAVAAMTGALMAFSGSPAAAAVAAPTVVLDCASGQSRFSCVAGLGGGAPTSIIWYVNGSRVSSWDGRKAVNGGCSASTTVSVTVSNAAGSDTSRPAWRACNSGPWQ